MTGGFIARLVRAHGLPLAVLGSAVAVVAGLALANYHLGVTRQPLPLPWLVAVVNITIAQLPLRGVLGPVELGAVRGVATRGARAAVALVLIAACVLTYAARHAGSGLPVLCLGLAAIGFAAARIGRADPWVWTLGVGLVAVGLEFITPWHPIGRYLAPTPTWIWVTAALVAAAWYVASPGLRMAFPGLAARRVRSARRTRPARHSGSARSADTARTAQ